jgi:hypothetical protein
MGSNNDESYRISLERFNAFESEISTLRQPTSRIPTPPLSLLAPADEDGIEGHPRLAPHTSNRFEMVEEGSNIPGLQVFALGELRSSHGDANNREGLQNPLLSMF